MITAVATLGVGTIIGYLAQRSRLCFVGGLRDFLLVRDTDLLKGASAFFLAAWLAFPLAALLGGVVWDLPALPDAGTLPAELTPGSPQAWPSLALPEPAAGAAAPFRPWLPALVAVAAGAGLGFISTLANGCPMRQHVLAGQGVRDSWFYLGGFYVGAVVYHAFLQPWLVQLIP